VSTASSTGSPPPRSKGSHGSCVRLFTLVYGVGTLVTIFMSNDATAVVLTPAILTAIRQSKVPPLPYLFALRHDRQPLPRSSCRFPIRQTWSSFMRVCRRWGDGSVPFGLPVDFFPSPRLIWSCGSFFPQGTCRPHRRRRSREAAFDHWQRWCWGASPPW